MMLFTSVSYAHLPDIVAECREMAQTNPKPTPKPILWQITAPFWFCILATLNTIIFAQR